ncbi:MAG: hypothetical protein JWM47_3766 [Acidimicrobiales bacterium]|nr:hypothetical protein [Acidimicrobiales bacterium]
MTATTATTTHSPTSTGVRRNAGVRTFTETKAGPKTTEFMLSIVFAVGVLIAAYASGDDALSRDDGWRYALIAIAAYTISRGLAKLGTREPYTEDAGNR